MSKELIVKVLEQTHQLYTNEMIIGGSSRKKVEN